MDKSAVLMNDRSKTTYTYEIQLPYLQIAMQELQEYFALHNVSVTQKTSIIIHVDAGDTELGYDSNPYRLPDDMIEPEQVWESNRGQDSFIPMVRKEYLSHNSNVQTSSFGVYTWNNGKLSFLSSNQNNDIKIDYIRQLFTEIINANSPINIVNARTFLEFRTAGLLAEFIESNDTAASKHNGYASLALDRATGITVKGKQSIMTRRRPFRSSYKSRR